jgi:hypothetical protein
MDEAAWPFWPLLMALASSPGGWFEEARRAAGEEIAPSGPAPSERSEPRRDAGPRCGVCRA